MLKQLIWEEIPHDKGAIKICRAAIFGGWLVFVENRITIRATTQYPITFVPDPNHEWDLKKSYNFKQ